MKPDDKATETEDGITITALIATYNRADYVAEALESVLSQTRPPDEVIVINDGSTDDTRHVLSRYRDRVSVVDKANGGKPSAINMGLARACSTHIWVFDDDDVALPDALAMHIDFLQKNPDCDFTYSACYYFSGDFNAANLDAYLFSALPRIAPHEYLVSTLEDMRGSMPGMLIPLRCYKAVGFFDEELLRTQDHDMVIRLARRFRAGRIDNATFAVRNHNGVRGPGFARHDGRRRFAVWREYQRRIFSRVRGELALHEYLPLATPADDAHLDARQRRRALTQRAYVMANRGLYDEAVADFIAANRHAHADAGLPCSDEKRLLSALTLIVTTENAAPADFYRRLGRAARDQRNTLTWLARGLYWSLARHGKTSRGLTRVGIATLAFSSGYAGKRSPRRVAGAEQRRP